MLTPVGTVLVGRTMAATAEGAATLLAWADQQTTGRGSCWWAWALDSARSHGVGLLRVLRAAREYILEALKPVTASRRRGGKSDGLDAIHATRAVLAADHLAVPAPMATGKSCGSCMSAAVTTVTLAPLPTTCFKS